MGVAASERRGEKLERILGFIRETYDNCYTNMK